jgi:IS5 family transposase
LLHIIGFGAIAPKLSDYGLEEALDDRLSFRQFIGLGTDEYAPENSAISRFRGQLIFYELDKQMEELGLLIKKGTLIDAIIVSASVSKPPKDKDGNQGVSEVDPEAEWTCKGNRG